MYVTTPSSAKLVDHDDYGWLRRFALYFYQQWFVELAQLQMHTWIDNYLSLFSAVPLSTVGRYIILILILTVTDPNILKMGGGRKTIYQLRPHLSQMRKTKYMPFTRKKRLFGQKIWASRGRSHRSPLNPPLNTNNNSDNERFVRAMYAEALTAVRMQTELTGVWRDEFWESPKRPDGMAHWRGSKGNWKGNCERVSQISAP